MGQQVGVAHGQHRVGRRADVGRREPGECGLRHRRPAAARRRAVLHGHREQAGLGERVQRLLDLRDDRDLLAVERRLVRVALLVVRREVPRRDLLAQVEHGVERLARVLGEPLALRSARRLAATRRAGSRGRGATAGGLHGAEAASGSPDSASTSMPNGDSVRTDSSRIRPRSSAVLNSTAISCAVRLPCGRSQR